MSEVVDGDMEDSEGEGEGDDHAHHRHTGTEPLHVLVKKVNYMYRTCKYMYHSSVTRNQTSNNYFIKCLCTVSKIFSNFGTTFCI